MEQEKYEKQDKQEEPEKQGTFFSINPRRSQLGDRLKHPKYYSCLGQQFRIASCRNMSRWSSLRKELGEAL